MNKREVRDCLDLFSFNLHGSGNRGHGYSVIVQEQILFLKQVEITKNLKHNYELYSKVKGISMHSDKGGILASILVLDVKV